MGWSDEDISKAIDSVKVPEKKKETETAPVQQTAPVAQEPRPLLQGGVSFTPAMQETASTIAQSRFPQATDVPLQAGLKQLLLPAHEAAEGLTQVPEDLLNLLGGGAQMALGVPQENRMSVGDAVRMIPGMNGFVTSGELPRSAAYQNAMQDNLANQLSVGGGRLAGGFMAPVGQMVGAMGKLPQLITSAAGKVPLLAKLGQAGAELPITSNAANTAQALMRQFQGGNAGLKAVGAGAGYGAAFGAGGQFGENRNIDAGQLGAEAGLGGMIGGGAHALQGMLQKAALTRQLQGSAQQVASQPAPDMSAPQVAPPNQMRDQLNALLTQNVLRRQSAGGEPRSAEHKTNVQARALKMFQNKYGNESLEHSEEITNTGNVFTKELLKARAYDERAAAAQKRADDQKSLLTHREKLQNQRTDNTGARTELERQKAQTIQQRTELERQRAETLRANTDLTKTRNDGLAGQTEAANARAAAQKNAREEGYNKETEHTLKGNAAYNDYRSRIENAGTSDEMNKVWAELHTPSAGPKGKPVLRPEQRSDLKDLWHSEYSRKFEDGEATPGKSGKPAAKPTGEKKPVEKKKDEAVPENNPTRKFIVGAFRKTFDKKTMGKRQDRYKMAVSVDKLAELGELSADETAKLKTHIEKCAVYRREQTYREQESRRLAEWAFKNKDEWIGNQGKVRAYNPVDEKADYLALQHMEREGKTSKILMRAKYEEAIENGMGGNHINYTRTRDDGEIINAIDTGRNTARMTLCGAVDKSKCVVNPDGSLKVEGGVKDIELPPFQKPKSADELFEQAEHLYERTQHFKTMLARQKEAGDIPKIMEKIWQKLKINWLNGEAPNVAMHHIDESGHLSVIEHQQPLMKGIQIELDEKLQKAIEAATDKDGKINYQILRGQGTIWNQLMRIQSIYLPGLTEVSIVAGALGRELNWIGRTLARGTGLDLLFAGTVDDVFRANAKFGGQKMSDMFHKMNAEISSNFLKDTKGEFVKIGGAEEFSALMNKFKFAPGQQKTLSGFQKIALDAASKKAKLEGRAVTQAEKDEALKEALTANMIVQKYKGLNKQVEVELEKMDIRKGDVETGIPSAGGHYLPEERHPENGTVLHSAYSRQYHEALKSLNKALSFQSDNSGYMADLVGNASQSILGNRPSTAIKNFFDQAPLTLAEYHKYFAQAVMDIHSNPKLREAITRLPGLPVAETHLARLQEWAANARVPNWKSEPAEFMAHAIKWVNYQIGVKWDLLFKGSSKLVSAADHAFHVYSSLASLYKSAAARGVDRNEFVSQLIEGKLGKATEDAVMAEWSKGLSQTLNTVAPHLNKDLFASTMLGQATQAFSTPARRAFKLMTGYVRDARHDPAAAAKLIGVSSAMVALGGRGAVPLTLAAIYKGAGMMTGNNEKVEQQLQSLDKMNILRQATGIDYANGFGPDIFTGGAPALEALEGIEGKVKREPWGTESPVEQAWNLTKIVALDGMHMFPRWGPFGSEVVEKFQRDLDSAATGHKKVYYDFPRKPVEINDYNYWDAVRASMFGGVEPKAREKINHERMQNAKKADAKYRAGNIMPPGKKESGAFLRTVFPRISGET